MELDLFTFATWLRCQPDDAAVGIVGDSWEGPLALWLLALTGERWVVCWSAESYRPFETREWRPLPLWAGMFHHWTQSYCEDFTDLSKELALTMVREVASELLEEGFLWMLESGQSAFLKGR